MQSLSPTQRAVLGEIGIDVWALRPNEAAPADWQELNARIRACTRCGLHATRTNAVCGSGDVRASWMVVGEAPGADEDAQGEPFVGAAGRLLNAMLRAVGLARDRVFVANVLKCRPPNNRNPGAEEAAECLPYLEEQIRFVAPDVLLVVGAVAAQNLLGVDTPVGRLRGKVHRYGKTGVPVVVTYHPAYLLRSPGQKARAWEDLLLARSVALESAA